MFWHPDKIFPLIISHFQTFVALADFPLLILMDFRIRNLISSIKIFLILIEIAFNSQVKIESLCSDFDIFSISSCLPLCPVVKAYGFLHIHISLLSVGFYYWILDTPTPIYTHMFWILSPFNWLIVCRRVVFSIVTLCLNNLLNSFKYLPFISFQLIFLDLLDILF